MDLIEFGRFFLFLHEKFWETIFRFEKNRASPTSFDALDPLLLPKMAVFNSNYLKRIVLLKRTVLKLLEVESIPTDLFKGFIVSVNILDAKSESKLGKILDGIFDTFFFWSFLLLNITVTLSIPRTASHQSSNRLHEGNSNFSIRFDIRQRTFNRIIRQLLPNIPIAFQWFRCILCRSD